MVALATLALQSAEKLFEKGHLKTKIWRAYFVWSWRLPKALVLIPFSE